MQTNAIQAGIPVAQSSVDSRATFIVKTYNTLFLSILAFAGVEVLLFTSGLAAPIAQALSGNWLLVLGGFLVVGWFGSRVAMTSTNKAATYAALGAYIVAEALIFVPMLYLANEVAPGAISSAALVTVMGFAGLTAIAWWSKKDFSFLGAILKWVGLSAIVLIVASLIFGFELGTFFSVGMVAFAGAAILFDTSNVLRHYPEDRYVAAALSLFASVALLFWYVLRLFMSRD